MIKIIRVTVDGKSYDVTVEIPDEQQPMAPAAAPVSEKPTPTAAPASASVQAGAGDVPSPLAGHVIAISATVGQGVEKGEPLVTIEAMKMNTFVLAPINGKVAAIKVKVGDAVDEGQILVCIE
jgi:biotin carboxyl carrier protein